ncbi:MAG: bifunctional folylpolyglutamate synthase/dihydrofolate synthase [Reinekea sp.]
MRPSISSSLSEWLQYIEAIHLSEIDLGLERLQQVSSRLFSAPVDSFVYTVAGTNGKGTTTAVLSALSMAAGLRVGWYSSPHIHRFNERVRINGIPVSDQALVKAFSRVEQARDEVSLSYFEYTTLAAFLVFAERNLDVWVLEVGLGGRLDAVNIIDPDISIITSIGMDHEDFLGNDIDGIGQEKAGIARQGAPLILGKDADIKGVIETAEAASAMIQSFGETHGVSGNELFWQSQRLIIEDIAIPKINAACALQAFAQGPGDLLLGQIRSVLQNLKMSGRLQRVSIGSSEVVLDVGHNPHAGAYICSELAGRQYHLIIGMLNNKDVAGFVRELQPICHSLSFVTLDVTKGNSAGTMQALYQDVDSETFASVGEALDALSHRYPSEDLFVGGSFYTVQQALDWLEHSRGS